MRIGLLEAGRSPPELSARFEPYEAMFRRLFDAVDGALDYAAYVVFEGELPASPDACDAYVVTGSPHGVYDRLAWMAATQAFAKSAVAAGRPVVGVCFGHQLLADAYGGTVEKVDRGWAVGIHEHVVHDTAPWMTPPEARFRTIASHQDQVTALPPDSTLLAGSDFCPNGMLQIGARVLTLQNHPEMPEAFAAALIERRRAIIGDEEADRALASLDTENDRHRLAQWLLAFMRR